MMSEKTIRWLGVAAAALAVVVAGVTGWAFVDEYPSWTLGVLALAAVAGLAAGAFLLRDAEKAPPWAGWTAAGAAVVAGAPAAWAWSVVDGAGAELARPSPSAASPSPWASSSRRRWAGAHGPRGTSG